MPEPFPTSNEGLASGCVVFLIDESDALNARIAGGTKSKAESVATVVNSLLNQPTAVADLEVAIVGYRCDDAGGADVGCRWSGPLAGRRLVPASLLADSPAAVENRTRRVPAHDGIGILEESVRFPVWYIPKLGSSVIPLMGYGYCQHLLASRMSSSAIWRKPPLVISFVGDCPPQKAQEAVQRVLSLAGPFGSPLLLHVHLGDATGSRPALYPSSDAFLPPGGPRDLFKLSSVLPDYMIAALRQAQAVVNTGARGMIFNATMADLIRLVGLVKTYAEQLGGVLEATESVASVRTEPENVD